MFFTEKEKAVYNAPNGIRYDPVSVDRRLIVATRNRLHELITLRNIAAEGLGDVSPQGVNDSAVEAAAAELELSSASRKAFGLPDFPECTDGEALELLYHFLGYLEGKGETAGTPPASPDRSPVRSSWPPTTITLPSG